MGRIFSIDEFSVFDGDGIRVSVFLKGCPLRCVWCHSPEGQEQQLQYLRAPAGCTGCGNCMTDKGLCEESIARCPKGLVRRCGEDIEPQALTECLLKLKGLADGVTFSGGEPLLQGDFLMECLGLLAGKMHRAVQTCGYADPNLFAAMLQQTDQVLMDLKLMDADAHRQYTGVDNDIILQNYRSLAQSDVPFVTRVPLIPTVTDTKENLTAIAVFLRENGVKYVELMPYNPMAGAKYKAVGRTWQPPYDESRPVCINKEIWQKNGVEVKIL